MASHHAPAASTANYEKDDAKVKPILVFTVLLVIANVATFYAMRWANDAYMRGESEKDRTTHPLATPNQEPPAPRLQAQPTAELVIFKAEQLNETTSYQWIDRSTGVVRLPIDRAMDVMSERGLPHRK